MLVSPGWQTVSDADGVRTDYYVRQLRDWKYSAPIEQFDPAVMAGYAGLCGWTLAAAVADGRVQARMGV
jgi:hypothetical protein